MSQSGAQAPAPREVTDTENTCSGRMVRKRSAAEATCALGPGGERCQWAELQRRGGKERRGPPWRLDAELGGSALILPGTDGEPVREAVPAAHREVTWLRRKRVPETRSEATAGRACDRSKLQRGGGGGCPARLPVCPGPVTCPLNRPGISYLITSPQFPHSEKRVDHNSRHFVRWTWRERGHRRARRRV